MKKQLWKSVLAAGLLAGISMAGWAQDTARTQPRSGSSMSASPADTKTVMFSGCLDRGSTADEYSLHVPTATSVELKSQSINLGGYLYKTVTVVAVDSGDGYGTLEVIDLRLDFPGCYSW